jgi:hypothetical protein
MKYRNFVGDVKVSALGYGCMRFPTNEKEIIEEEAIAAVRHAIDAGVNYVDTAFGYHGGKSEVVLGKALRDGYREKVYLADKMPVWMIEKEEDFERLFNIQLERLGVDHIDFYMLHALGKGSFEDKVKKFGLVEKMRALKASGRVSYIGFSFHDSNAVFPDQISCRDDNYNHGLYPGWFNYGQIIATPLCTSPIYNTNGIQRILNNRVEAFHIGLEGDAMDWLGYRVLYTCSNNWGTYEVPFKDIKVNRSAMLELTFKPQVMRGWSIAASLALDNGDLYGNNCGGMLTIKGHNIFNTGKNR